MPMSMAKRKEKKRGKNREKTNCIKVGENVEQLGPSRMAGWKIGADILQDSVVTFYEVKHTPITQPNHSTRIYPMEMKVYAQTKTCPQILIAALFLTAQTANNPNVH